MTTKRIIFHAGAPKTGSTSLQTKIGQEKALLARHGVRFLPRQVIKKNFHPLHHIIRDLKKEKNRDVALERGRNYLAREFETADVLIISNEDALFDEKIQKIRKSLFTRVEEQTDLLSALFEGYEVICFMTIRNWKSWLPSNYFQMVRQGETRSLKRFVQSLSSDDLNWCLPVEALIRSFGRESVHIVTHESLQAAPTFLFQHILKAAGVPDPRVEEMPSINKSYGVGTINYMRFWNWVFQLRKRSPKVRRFIRQKIYPYLTYWLTFTPALKLVGKVGQQQDERYQQQVASLREVTLPKDE